MLPGGLPIESTSRARSRAALVAATLVAAFGALDVARGSRALAAILCARALWIASLVLLSWIVRRPRASSGPLSVLACTSVASIAVLVHEGGGTASGSFVYLVTAPVFVALFLPNRVAPSALAGLVATGCVAAVSYLQGRAAADVAALAARAAIAGGFAILFTWQQNRVRREEIDVVGHLARLAEALEASERRLAEEEPLAAAGTKARDVAHSMSSPLAAISCNLDWLRDAAQDGRVRLEDEEAAGVIDDARAAADRLRERIGALRQAAAQVNVSPHR